MKIALVILVASSVLVVTALRLLGIDTERQSPGRAMPRLIRGVIAFSLIVAIAVILLLRWITGFLEGVLS